MNHVYIVVETDSGGVTYLPDTPIVTNMRAFTNRGPAHKFAEQRRATLEARSYKGVSVHVDLVTLDESPEVRK